MVDQVKSVDFRARRAEFIGHAPPSLLTEVLAVLDAIVF
jgi:mRNA-degrading endonuclease toxin of MazEF toxin-antitoxin module